MSVLRTGTWTNSVISQSIINKYDTNYYVEPDGSIWIRIVHHNNPNANGFFAQTDSFTTSVYKNEHKWFNAALCNLITSGIWEFMVKQTLTSGATETKYRWTQTKNPFYASWTDVSPTSGNATMNTSSGYSSGSVATGGLYLKNNGTYFVIANPVNGNWFGAFGSWNTTWSNSLPGYPNSTVSTGYMDLYLRVDNVTLTKASLYKSGTGSNVSANGLAATDFIEI